jgi:hypothetical protein
MTGGFAHVGTEGALLSARGATAGLSMWAFSLKKRRKCLVFGSCDCHRIGAEVCRFRTSVASIPTCICL